MWIPNSAYKNRWLERVTLVTEIFFTFVTHSYRDLLYLTIVCTVYHNSLDSYSFLPFSPFLFLFLPPLLFSSNSFSPFPLFLSTSPLPPVSLYSCPQGTALGIIALGCLFSLTFHLLTREPSTTSEQKSETARGGKLPWYKWLTKPQFYLVRRNSCTYSDPKMRQELQKKTKNIPHFQAPPTVQ